MPEDAVPDRLTHGDVDRLLQAARDLPEPVSPRVRRLVVIVSLAAVLGFFGLLTANLIHVANLAGVVAHNQRMNTRALCALRGDLKRRVVADDEFLRRHRRERSSETALVASSAANARASIRALSVIVCPEDED
jgi:hypothetical protein